MKGKFDSQLATLRGDKKLPRTMRKIVFRWVQGLGNILSAIFNHLMRLESIQRGIDLGTKRRADGIQAPRRRG